MPSKILCVDDHAIVATGLEKVAEKVRGGALISIATDGAEALRRARQEAWDLIVLDISLQGRSGLEVLKDLKQLAPKLPVLMFSLHKSVEFVRRALKFGAAGYVSKDSPSEELVAALNAVLAGGKYISVALRDELIYSPEAAGQRDLSGREFEVLIKIAEGKTIKEIAADLCISENTVETYRARVREKMGMKRDAELIRYCVAAGLVTDLVPPVTEAESPSGLSTQHPFH